MTEIIHFVLFYLELLIYSLDDHNPLGFFLFKLYKSVSDTTSTLKLRIEGYETCSLTTGVLTYKQVDRTGINHRVLSIHLLYCDFNLS